MATQKIDTEVCPLCGKPVNVDKAWTHPQTKELVHKECLQNVSPPEVSTGKLVSGSQKFHNSAARRGMESYCDAMSEIATRNE